MRTLSAGTAQGALTAATDALQAAGVAAARLDAELMLAEATGHSRTQLAAHPEAPVAPPQARLFGEMVRRRLRREPLAYILGRRGFRRLELAVDRRVLIPRPETEHLVEVAVERRPLAVLDVGTGSGAVALAVADELPAAEVVATDTSPPALEVARLNARLLGLADRVRFHPGSLPAGGSFDLVLANLPYVSEAEWDSLEPEVREHEPREALVAGPTGLEAIEAMLGRLALAAGLGAAALALEVGQGQAATVAELVRRTGFERVERRPDLAGIERVVVGSAAEARP